MDTFEKLGVIVAVKSREAVGNEEGLRRGLRLPPGRRKPVSSLGYVLRGAVAES